MQVTLVLLIIAIMAGTLSYADGSNVERQIIDWNSYGREEVLKDLKSFLNQSEIELFELATKRYPGLINVFKNILIEATVRGNFSESQLCTKMEQAIDQINDSCKISPAEIAKDINLTKACNDSAYESSLFETNLSNLCKKKQIENTSNSTKPTVRLQSGSFFLAVKVMAGTAVAAGRRRCEEYGGAFDEEKFSCFKNGTYLAIKPATDEALRITIVVGNSISFLSLIFLLVTYVKFRKYSSLAGKNIICLSAALLFVHFLQIILAYLYEKDWVCRAGAVVLQLTLLLAFSWMAVIAFEFHHTFSKVRPVDQYQRKKRFQKYLIFSFTFSILVVFICLMIDIPEGRYSGYGLNEKCFVSKFWTNLFAFVVPVAAVLLSNVTLLILTIWQLRKIKKSTAKSLHSNTNTVAKKREMTLSIMALKLSILLGFGWIFGFIEASYESKALRYIYSIVIAFQGLFVLVAFGCHKECWDVVKMKRPKMNETVTQTSMIEMNTV